MKRMTLFFAIVLVLRISLSLLSDWLDIQEHIVWDLPVPVWNMVIFAYDAILTGIAFFAGAVYLKDKSIVPGLGLWIVMSALSVAILWPAFTQLQSNGSATGFIASGWMSYLFSVVGCVVGCALGDVVGRGRDSGFANAH